METIQPPNVITHNVPPHIPQKGHHQDLYSRIHRRFARRSSGQIAGYDQTATHTPTELVTVTGLVTEMVTATTAGLQLGGRIAENGMNGHYTSLVRDAHPPVLKGYNSRKTGR